MGKYRDCCNHQVQEWVVYFSAIKCVSVCNLFILEMTRILQTTSFASRITVAQFAPKGGLNTWQSTAPKGFT